VPACASRRRTTIAWGRSSLMSDAEWSRNFFRLLKDGGTWGVPRSGLIFVRRGNTLVLVDTMPHMPEMPLSPEELAQYQEDDYETIKDRFGQAGIEVHKELT
jgi:hypothetical protein